MVKRPYGIYRLISREGLHNIYPDSGNHFGIGISVRHNEDTWVLI